MITPEQCRAGRGLLDWTQQKLADQAQVGVVTIRHLEAGGNAPRRATLEVIQRAFELAGVELINENSGTGVVLRKR
jgi:predicted transcriptional regulator